MSVSNTASTASFSLNQTTSTFTFTFRALTSTPTDIKAIITTNSTNQNLTYTTDYTVAVDADGVGGVLTLVSPATHSKGTLTVYRDTTNLQESDYDDYNQFPADTLETDLDKRTLVSQEQAEKFTRTLLLPITVTGVSTTLPIPVAQKVIGWSVGALSLCNYDNAATSVTAAASSATAALSSQTAAASSATSAGLYASTASTQALIAASHATTALTASTTAVKNDGTVNPTNLLSNGDFETWSAGTAVAPDGWTLDGTGAAAAREGTIIKLGTYSAKLTRGSGDASFYQRIHAAKGITYWKGRKLTLGCWIYSATLNTARVSVYDGVDSSVSSYHTGNSTWQWLSCTHTVNASATLLELDLQIITQEVSAYFDGAICVEGESAFAFSPKPAEEGVWSDYFATSTIVGWAASPTGNIYTKKIGKTVFVSASITGTSSTTAVTFTVPYTSANTTITTPIHYGWESYDNGTKLGIAAAGLPANSAVVTCYKDIESAAWTNSGTKTVRLSFWYESA